jgi:hypothetical protein
MAEPGFLPVSVVISSPFDFFVRNQIECRRRCCIWSVFEIIAARADYRRVSPERSRSLRPHNSLVEAFIACWSISTIVDHTFCFSQSP